MGRQLVIFGADRHASARPCRSALFLLAARPSSAPVPANVVALTVTVGGQRLGEPPLHVRAPRGGAAGRATTGAARRRLPGRPRSVDGRAARRVRPRRQRVAETVAVVASWALTTLVRSPCSDGRRHARPPSATRQGAPRPPTDSRHEPHHWTCTDDPDLRPPGPAGPDRSGPPFLTTPLRIRSAGPPRRLERVRGPSLGAVLRGRGEDTRRPGRGPDRRCSVAARRHARPVHVGAVGVRVGELVLLRRGAGRIAELEGVLLRLLRRRATRSPSTSRRCRCGRWRCRCGSSA